MLPIRAGHTLVIPKAHIPKLSDLPPDLASAVGEAVSKVANALTEGTLLHTRNMLYVQLESMILYKAMGNTGLNVVCNQEYAQAVPHVSAVHCRSKLKLFEFLFFHRYITTLYLRPNWNQVCRLVNRPLKSRFSSRMKRCIKRNSSRDMNLMTMKRLNLRKR